mmetsp:Transcript_49992/g.93515  ORF Transcript_49992/g.93515 Transcript_49992/m.93515 type:complete len:176 (+) Transcript_49992:53-580(+)
MLLVPLVLAVVSLLGVGATRAGLASDYSKLHRGEDVEISDHQVLGKPTGHPKVSYTGWGLAEGAEAWFAGQIEQCWSSKVSEWVACLKSQKSIWEKKGRATPAEVIIVEGLIMGMGFTNEATAKWFAGYSWGPYTVAIWQIKPLQPTEQSATDKAFTHGMFKHKVGWGDNLQYRG